MLTYLIRTNSLDSDDRFDKTLKFLEECGEKVTVFGVVKKISSRSDRFVERLLWLRRRLPSGNLAALKYTELLMRTALFMLGTFGARRWYANFDFLPLHALTALFAGRSKRPIWDLHEMPPGLASRNTAMRWLFAFLLQRSHVIVCNEARREALEETFGVALPNALVLRNYPSAETRAQLVNARQAHLASVSDRQDALSIVIIGGNVPGRYVAQSIDVIANLRAQTGLDIKVIMAGGAPLPNAPDFVSSTGFVPFHELILHCVKGSTSLCFYQMSTVNNILCEPNRFYQGLLAGQYVISFDHPSLDDIHSSLRRIVDEDEFSVSLERTLKDLLDKLLAVKATETLICDTGMGEFVFENQFAAFSDWRQT